MKKIISTIGFVVLVFGAAQQTMATLNSNFIVEDDIEYYVQTDKAIYDLGEDVEMLYRVTNLGDENETFYFGNSPEWNFWVEKDGNNIWTAVDGWYGFGSVFTLAPNESKEFPAYSSPYVWDMRDNENYLINAGEYDVIGGLDQGFPGNYLYSRVSVPITVVPEPATIFLFAVTGLLIRKNERCNF